MSSSLRTKEWFRHFIQGFMACAEVNDLQMIPGEDSICVRITREKGVDAFGVRTTVVREKTIAYDPGIDLGGVCKDIITC